MITDIPWINFNPTRRPGLIDTFGTIDYPSLSYFSIWNDQRGHLGPGFDRLEGYVFYATLYGKSPELISAPITFKKNPGFLTADVDKILREIAWKAVVEHPLSGVTDKNGNGIGDHLE